MNAQPILTRSSMIARGMAMSVALLLMLAALLAARWGWSAVIAAQEGQAQQDQRNLLMRTGQTPSPEALHAQYEQLAMAQKLDPQNPALMELIGELAEEMMGQFLAASIPAENLSGRAIVEYAKAVIARPVSPYSWANFARAKYQAGQVDATFYAALENAAKLGPWEPEVQFAVMDLGFALWDEMPKPMQPMIKKVAANAERRYPDRVMTIAAKRGKLGLVCDFEKLAKMVACGVVSKAVAA